MLALGYIENRTISDIALPLTNQKSVFLSSMRYSVDISIPRQNYTYSKYFNDSFSRKIFYAVAKKLIETY